MQLQRSASSGNNSKSCSLGKLIHAASISFLYVILSKDLPLAYVMLRQSGTTTVAQLVLLIKNCSAAFYDLQAEDGAGLLLQPGAHRELIAADLYGDAALYQRQLKSCSIADENWDLIHVTTVHHLHMDLAVQRRPTHVVVFILHDTCITLATFKHSINPSLPLVHIYILDSLFTPISRNALFLVTT